MQRDREARAGVGSAEGTGVAGEGAGARFTQRSFWLPRRCARGPPGAACRNPGLKEGDGIVLLMFTCSARPWRPPALSEEVGIVGHQHLEPKCPLYIWTQLHPSWKVLAF